jgi:hypothetical protein
MPAREFKQQKAGFTRVIMPSVRSKDRVADVAAKKQFFGVADTQIALANLRAV